MVMEASTVIREEREEDTSEILDMMEDIAIVVVLVMAVVLAAAAAIISREAVELETAPKVRAAAEAVVLPGVTIRVLQSAVALTLEAAVRPAVITAISLQRALMEEHLAAEEALGTEATAAMEETAPYISHIQYTYYPAAPARSLKRLLVCGMLSSPILMHRAGLCPMDLP
jgi:hypothetical protein